MSWKDFYYRVRLQLYSHPSSSSLQYSIHRHFSGLLRWLRVHTFLQSYKYSYLRWRLSLTRDEIHNCCESLVAVSMVAESVDSDTIREDKEDEGNGSENGLGPMIIWEGSIILRVRVSFPDSREFLTGSPSFDTSLSLLELRGSINLPSSSHAAWPIMFVHSLKRSSQCNENSQHNRRS